MAAPARAVHRLTPGQQRVARWGALFAAVVFVGIWVPSFPEGEAVGWAALGVAMAALLYLAARRGSLVLTAMAAFVVSFGPWGALSLLGAPYIAWSGVLLYRASREATAQRLANAAVEKAKREQAEPAAAKRAATAATASERRAPSQSKRYTPPATKKKRR